MNAASNRSIDDAKAKHELLGQYIAECDRIEAFKADETYWTDGYLSAMSGTYEINSYERLSVFENRRDKLLKDLENKSIRIQADSESLPTIARALEAQKDSK